MCFSIHGKIHLTFVKSCLKIQRKRHATFPVASFYAFVEVRNKKNVSLGRSFKKILCVSKGKDAVKQDMSGGNNKQSWLRNSFSAKFTMTE